MIVLVAFYLRFAVKLSTHTRVCPSCLSYILCCLFCPPHVHFTACFLVISFYYSFPFLFLSWSILFPSLFFSLGLSYSLYPSLFSVLSYHLVCLLYVYCFHLVLLRVYLHLRNPSLTTPSSFVSQSYPLYGSSGSLGLGARKGPW